jgi:hypothetical protein
VSRLLSVAFEPEARRPHLAIGETPSSKVPLKALELKGLFE